LVGGAKLAKQPAQVSRQTAITCAPMVGIVNYRYIKRLVNTQNYTKDKTKIKKI